MILGIHGSKNFNDYNIFLSGMARALYSMRDSEDREFTIFSAGPYRVTQMAEEYLNVSNFKSRGIKTKLVRVPLKWFKTNHPVIDQFAYFCNHKESIPEIMNFMSAKDVKNDVYRY